jgi:DNA repair protein RadC
MRTQGSPRIRDLPTEDRPREKLTLRGAEFLSDAEILAIFLRTGTRTRSAVDLARDLLQAFGSLQALSRVSPAELQRQIKGVGPAKAAELVALFEIGRRLAQERCAAIPLQTSQAVYDLMAPEMQRLAHESLRVLLLNTRYVLIRSAEVSRGSVNESVAHPREILRPAIVESAFAFILVHNHPSGDPSPSQADRRLTSRLAEAARLVQIEMLDHIIIGLPGDHREPFFSFRDSGLL